MSVEQLAGIGGAVASGSWAAAAQQGATLAAEELGKTDAGEWVEETGTEMLAAASIGASAGLACGPLAPVCSAIGAIAGALIALGVAIADLFKDEASTVPCLVDDLGGKVARRCYGVKDIHQGGSAWSVEPNDFEIQMGAFPIGPHMTMGKLLWSLRRIKEDGLGINHVWRVHAAMGIKPTLMALPTQKQINEYAAQVLAPQLPSVIHAQARDAISRYAANITAGASMPQAYKALGGTPPAGSLARYNRTINLLEQEYSAIPLPPPPGFGVFPMARPFTRSDSITRAIVGSLAPSAAITTYAGDAPTKPPGEMSFFAKEAETLTGAGVGAVLGGVLGRVLSGSWTGAAIGAGVGAVAVGGVTYAIAGGDA